MRDILAKLAKLNESVDEHGNYRQPIAPIKQPGDDSDGALGIAQEAAGPSALSKVYPNTRDGVLQYMQYGYDKSFLKRLDLPTCTIHWDPSVEGVWAVDSPASGFRCVIYLAGYRDPWGQKRETNDSEEGSLPMSVMKSMAMNGTLTPKLMQHWEKCGSLDDPKIKEKLTRIYNEYNGLDEGIFNDVMSSAREPINFNDDNLDSLSPEELYSEFSKVAAQTGKTLKQVALEKGNGDDRYWRKVMWVGESTVDEATNFMGEKEYTSFNSWKSACRKVNPNVRFEGDQDICQAKPGVGEWDGVTGVLYNDYAQSNPDNLDEAGGYGYDDEVYNKVVPLRDIPDEPGISQEELARTLYARIEYRHPEAITNYGAEALWNAIDDVASFHAGATELGTSDISIMVNQVMKQLEPKTEGAYGDDGWEPPWEKLDRFDPNSDPDYAYDKARQEKVDNEPLEEAPENNYQLFDFTTITAADGYGTCDAVLINDRTGKETFVHVVFSYSPEDLSGEVSIELEQVTNDKGKEYPIYQLEFDTDELVDAIKADAENVVESGQGNRWKVSYWVERQGHGDEPGTDVEDSQVVTAGSAEEAFQLVKSKKTPGEMRYSFKVTPFTGNDLDESNDSEEGKQTKINEYTNYRIPKEATLLKSKIVGWVHVKLLKTPNGRFLVVSDTTKGPGRNRLVFLVKSTKSSDEALEYFKKEVAQMTDFANRDYSNFNEGKRTMRKNKINEDIDTGNAPPELAKILRHFGKELADFQNNGELDDDLYSALYDYYFDDMPYGTKKARTGDPYEWISQRLDSDINYKFGDVSDKYMAQQNLAPTEGFGSDTMPLESVGDSVDLEPQPGEEVITELRAEDESRITDMLTSIGLDHGLDFWFEGNEIVVIGSREAKLVTSTVGGHIQSIDGEEFRIGANPRTPKQAPADINDLAAEPELMDGMFEGKMSEKDIENKEKREKAAKEAREKKKEEAKKLKEDVSADDVEMLTLKFKSGLISYDQFRSELDSLEQTDYSMRQGEMGMYDGDTPAGHRHYQADQDDYDEFGEPEDEFEEDVTDPTNLDQTDLDYSQWGKKGGTDFSGINKLDMTGSQPKNLGNDPGYGVEEGEFANSAENPAKPEVHTSTTDMINQGNDLNRPKKSFSSKPYRGDNPMAEARGLMKQYNTMLSKIKISEDRLDRELDGEESDDDYFDRQKVNGKIPKDIKNPNGKIGVTYKCTCKSKFDKNGVFLGKTKTNKNCQIHGRNAK